MSSKGARAHAFIIALVFLPSSAFCVSLFDAGLARAAKSDWHAAAIDFERATKENPSDMLAWYNLGVAHTNLQQWPKAVRAFREAVRLDPTYRKALIGLAFALEKTGAYDEAVVYYRQVAALSPPDRDPHPKQQAAFKCFPTFCTTRIFCRSRTAPRASILGG